MSSFSPPPPIRDKKKPAAIWGGRGQFKTGQRRSMTVAGNIIPPPAENSKLQHALEAAADDHDWRRWWRIYCEAHGVPWPPTGAAIKRALMLRTVQRG